MVAWKRMCVGGFTVAATVLATLAVPRAAAVTTTVRYAAPHGTGTACTASTPCSINQALLAPPTATRVVLEPGSYGTASAPLPSELAVGSGITSIGGAPGGAPVAIYSNGTPDAISVASGTLHDVTVVSTAGVAIGTVAPGTATRVTGWSTAATGIGCDIASMLTDSVCLATGTAGIAVASRQLSPGDLVTAIRNVTAEAPGTSGTGLRAAAYTGAETASLTVDATNDILAGSLVDVASVPGGPAATAEIFLRHSDFDPDQTVGGDAIDSDATNISGPPAFVDASHGDLREKPTSPTVDAGAPRPAGTLDRLGHPRDIGKAPDIGAYELLVKPAITAVRVTKRTREAIIGYVRGNGFGLPAHIKVVVRRHGHLVAGLKAPRTPSHAFKAHFALHFLRRHTAYHLQAVVHTIGGTTRSPSRTVRTRR